MGSVVRRVVGSSIVKHLDEVPQAEEVVQEAARRAAKVNLKIAAPVIVVAAAAAGAAHFFSKRKKTGRGAQDVAPDCVLAFEGSLRTYVEAGRNGTLDAGTVDRLIVNLDEVRAWTDGGNTVAFSFEQLEPLFRLVIEHTPALASAYSVPLPDVEVSGSKSDDGVVIQLRQHLEMQKKILDTAA